MSLESWKKEFYPIEAKNCTKEKALQHSLQKWIGLRKENLDKHDVVVSFRRIRDIFNNWLAIDDSSCALCVHFKVFKSKFIDCSKCPLWEANDFYPCDQYKDDSSYSQFGYWLINDDPEPMIALLTAAIEMQKKNSPPPGR